MRTRLLPANYRLVPIPSMLAPRTTLRLLERHCILWVRKQVVAANQRLMRLNKPLLALTSYQLRHDHAVRGMIMHGVSLGLFGVSVFLHRLNARFHPPQESTNNAAQNRKG